MFVSFFAGLGRDVRQFAKSVRKAITAWRVRRRASRPGYVPSPRQLGIAGNRVGKRRAAPLHARVIAAIVPASVRSTSRRGLVSRSRRIAATRRPASRGAKVGRHGAGRPGTDHKLASDALKRKLDADRRFSQRATGELSFGDTLRLARHEN